MFDSITTKWLHTEVCTLKSGQSLGVLNLVWMTVRNFCEEKAQQKKVTGEIGMKSGENGMKS